VSRKVAVSLLVFLAFGVSWPLLSRACATDKPAPPTLRIDPLLVAQAAEVWQLVARPNNPVWPGWDASSTPLLFYLPDTQDVLINHPRPPEGFHRYTGPVKMPGAEIFVRDDKTFFDLDGQNTARAVAGVSTLVIADTLSNHRQQIKGLLEDPLPAAKKAAQLGWKQLHGDPYGSICMIAHEAFHVYQGKRAPHKGGSEEALTRYPTVASFNTVGFALEGALLAEAMRATDPAEVRKHALSWLAIRLERRAKLSTEAASYEDRMEYLEGLAKYVEYRLLEVLEGRTPGEPMNWLQGFNGYADLKPQREALIRQTMGMMSGKVGVNNDLYGASPLRMRLYFSGMGIAVLLDRVAPKWKERIFAPETTLTGLAKEALKPTDEVLEAARKAVRARPDYAALVEQKSKLEADGKEAVRKAVADIEGGASTKLVLDYSALGKERPGFSFTPFGILRVDDDRTIFRLIPISGKLGKTTFRQTSAAPLLQNRALKRLSWQLPETVSAAQLEKLIGGKVGENAVVDLKKLSLPGVKLDGGRGELRLQGGTLEIRLQPAARVH
jgi:hypothetical protein